MKHLAHLKLVHMAMGALTLLVLVTVFGWIVLGSDEGLATNQAVLVSVILAAVLLAIAALFIATGRLVGRGQGRSLATVLALLQLGNCPGIFIAAYTVWVCWINAESKAVFDAGGTASYQSAGPGQAQAAGHAGSSETPDSSGKVVILGAVLLGGMLVLCGVGGILASIAIPNFITMGQKAKLAEAPLNLNGIRTAELAYFAQWGQFTSAAPTPQSVPGRTQAAFEPSPGFQALGWSPDGKVRCQYQVVAMPGETPEAADFVATSTCDADGDGEYSTWKASRKSQANRTTPRSVY